jgi:CubicO group peptidase (beta-lactamase class C family)
MSERASLAKTVERLAGEHPFSGVVRVSVGGEVVLERGWGHRNRAEGLPCEPDTRFGIASGAKTFTAVAICRLAERGLLSLEDTVHDHVSIDLPDIDAGVTIRHLLTHTSGIADYFDEEEMDDFEALWRERPAYTVREPRDVFEMFRGKGMKFIPGEHFSYCNAGFILLGLVIEDKTGSPFALHVGESVFETAGMLDSGYFAMDELPERTALGYVRTAGGWKTNIFSVPAVGQPDGGAFTTVPDMERFWDAIMDGTLLSPRLASELLGPRVEASSERPMAGYGLGLWTEDLGGGDVLRYASGSDPGVGFDSGFARDGAVRVTVIRNSDGPSWSVFRGVAREVLDSA